MRKSRGKEKKETERNSGEMKKRKGCRKKEKVEAKICINTKIRLRFAKFSSNLFHSIPHRNKRTRSSQ